MGLEELNEQLHGRDFHVDRTRRNDTFTPGNQPDGQGASKFQKTEKWNESSLPKEFILAEPVRAIISPDDVTKKRRKLIALVLGGIACVLLIGGVILKIRAGLFSPENIVLNIAGGGSAGSAELVTFDFEYANNNWMDLENASVVFEYPESFHPEASSRLEIKKSRAEGKIGTIKSKGQGTVSLSGKFYGSKGDQAKIYATLRYSPSALSSTFEKRVEHTVGISSSTLFFEINAPLELASDQEAQYEVRYRNEGDTAFSNLKIKLEYPAGFVFTDADTPSSGDGTVWEVGTLAPGQEGTLVVRGRLSGARDEQKTVHGDIGFFQGDGSFLSYGEGQRKTKVIASPFVIRQTVEGATAATIDPGRDLRYALEYRNEGNVGIRDAIITVELDTPYLDFSTLQFEGGIFGAYNQARKAISWKASDFPALNRVEPGQSGKVAFSIKSYAAPTKKVAAARNPLIVSVAKIDSPDIPAIVGVTKVVASNTLSVKLNSVVTSTLEVQYQDTVIPNSGPTPPVVGQETTYTFHLALDNTSNSLRDARMNILLPTGIRYTGNIVGAGEKTFFNERTNELVWDMGVFAPETRREIVFQVGVTPSPGTRENDIMLVSQALFTGKDTFTETEIRVMEGKKTNAGLAPLAGAPAPDAESTNQ
ncbi:MAG: hypothetical protein WA082_00970 [Candidatus Moraniibacteriota bacterium]